MYNLRMKNSKEYRVMKKLSILTTIIVVIALLASCAGTKEQQATEQIPSDVSVTTISEPVAAAEDFDFDTVVISEGLSLTDDELESQFSYIYGYLLGSNIVKEESNLSYRPLIIGSTDFYNYQDPMIDEYDMEMLFYVYQDYVDGLLSVEQLNEEAGEAVGFLETYFDKLSYAYGYILQFNLQSQGLIVELDSFNDGISDTFNGIELNKSEEQIDQIFSAYQDLMEGRYETLIAELGEVNLLEAEQFLAENKNKENIIETSSGLQYEIITQGKGSNAKSTDDVVVDYLITFLDGTTGDNSYYRGEPSTFNLENLIPGFSEGVQLMNEGSHYRFYLHPSLAYGERGSNEIQPNALLIFDIELHEILK